MYTGNLSYFSLPPPKKNFLKKEKIYKRYKIYLKYMYLVKQLSTVDATNFRPSNFWIYTNWISSNF